MQKRITKEKTKCLALMTVLVAVVALASSTGAAGPPYPPSSVIKSIAWHWDTHATAAPGSDLWPVTWASDGNIYTAWGDGGGFGGTNSDGRVSMGFARIKGAPESYVGINVNGGKNPEAPASFPQKGKTGGLLSVNGTLYARLNLQDGEWPAVNFGLAWSEDLGATWAKASWVFPKGGGNFKLARFLNFGKDYAGVPAHLAGFVYFYGFKQDTNPGSNKSTYLGRVPQDKIKDRSAYEFFKGLDANGKPIWTSDVKELQPVFTDPNGNSAGAVVYNPGIKRCILTSYHTGPGQLGIFDAPEPWGPWTTVAYYDNWGNMGAVGFGLNCDFPQKWMSTDGLTMWCVFSVYGDGAKKGIDGHDKFNLVKATLTLLPNEDHGETNRDNDRIQIYKENPRYWQYKGKPLLLLGGSDDDNLFQWTGTRLIEQLNLLKSVGGNYVRCTMSGRDEGNVWPFKQVKGKYDLAKWDEEYWRRFENFLKLTHERDIIVQVEIWATYDFYREFWQRHPLNPKNNINYTAEQTGLSERVDHRPGYSENVFFQSVPAAGNQKTVLKYQRGFVGKMLSHTLKFGHVLYSMDNETAATPQWGKYWSEYVKAKAKRTGVVVQTTEMWYDHLDKDPPIPHATFDHPETYSFVDVSQNSHKRGQRHWDSLRLQLSRVDDNVRPLTNVKIYGADTGPERWFRADVDGVERFWRNIFGGMASARFHRPPYGLGLTDKAQANIHSLRLLTDDMDIFTCAARNDLLPDRKPNEAYCLANPGKEYAVYFPNGGEVTLDISDLKGIAKAKWLDIAQSKWKTQQTLEVGRGVVLRVPQSGPWAVLVSKMRAGGSI